MAPVGATPARAVAGVVERAGPNESLTGRLHAVLNDAVRTLGADLGGTAVLLTRLSPPTPVCSELLHALVDVLLASGCDEVVVGTSVGTRDRDRGHSSAVQLANLAGLTGRTGRGACYTVVDLSCDTVPAPLPAASVLDAQPVSRLWLEAGTRVLAGRAVTDLLDGCAGALGTFLGAAPEIAGAAPRDVCVDLLRCAAPALVVVDALAVSGGGDGGRILAPVSTETVLVTTDAVLADCTLATLLGEDRSSSRLVEGALAELGEPAGRVEGDLTPWRGVARPHPLARRAARRVAEDARLARVVSAATGGPDSGAAPADPVLSAVRTVLTPAVKAADDPVGQASLLAILGAVAGVTSMGESWAATFDKDRVDRRVVPLGFDPGRFADEEFDFLPGFLAPFEAVIEALPQATGDGFRWTLVDGATVFEVSRLIAADFDDFVARVDVAEGISLMADYLGGRRVRVGGPVAPAPVSPTTTRVRQAERNLYLPQPNYIAAWGGQPIDVCKIELVECGPDQHRLSWRTVRSPNGSATHDDGSLSFTRTDGGTMATVRGRQLFTVPPVVAAADLAAVPELHAPLLEDAYRRFFTTTFDNLEACFEGRDFRIGRPPPDPTEPLLTELVQLVLDAVGDRARSGSLRTSSTAAGRAVGDVDGQGFRHVRGPR